MEPTEHDHFIARADRFFPGSTITSEETYESAKNRLQEWVGSLKQWLPPEERLCLLAEACWAVWLRGDQTHRLWAEWFLAELATKLERLHALGMARDFPTIEVCTWKRRPRYTQLHHIPQPLRAELLGY